MSSNDEYQHRAEWIKEVYHPFSKAARKSASTTVGIGFPCSCGRDLVLYIFEESAICPKCKTIHKWGSDKK